MKPISEAMDDEMPGNVDAKPKAAPSENAVLELLPPLNMGEKSYADSSYWAESQIKPYNPDDLVQRRYDYSIYEDMVNDDQVNVCLRLKKDLVIGAGFDFVAEEGGDDSIKEDLEIAFNEDPEIDFEESLEEIVSAYEFGFSLSEPIFKKRVDGSATLRAIKTRHPVTWLIHTDEKGNVIRYEQRGPEGSIDVSPDALIHYVNQPRFQNPYGRSDLRAAYQAWFVKREIIKFYAIFLEKAASPTPVARFDKNAPQQAVDDIHNAIKRLQTKTALTIPKDIEMEYLESKSNGEVYIKGINLFNMFIGRSLLIPDLLGFQGGETSGGSYSLGKDQMEVFFRHIARRRRTLEKIINRRIVLPLVKHNFGNIDKFPKFRFKPVKDDDALELAKVWIEAVKGKLYKPSDEEINHFRKLAKFPEGPVEREAPIMQVPGQAPIGPDGKPMPMDEGSPEGQSQATGKEGAGAPGSDGSKEAKSPSAAPSSKASDKKEEQAEKKGDEDADEEEEKAGKKSFKKVYQSPSLDYSKKVNFKLIENTMDQYSEQVLTESKSIIREIFNDLSNQIRSKKILETQSLEKIDKLKVKYGSKLAQLLKSRFKEAHRDAKRQAQIELLGTANYRAPLPNEEFMRFLEEETFQYVGDFEYNVKKNARLKLVEAIKDGKPLSQVMDVLDDEGVALSEQSLERYARTKFTEVMNRGRHEFFEESGVVAAYQYSAILDDRTTSVCEGLHGKVFEKGSEPIPPLHFNCRSLLVPITKYEDYKADTKVGSKPIEQFITENKGEGFSKM
jgi:SPP1 gp7 family putative phage head morphogenesis protein